MRNIKKNLLQCSDTSMDFFEKIAIDILGPFPTSYRGYKYILGVICQATRYLILIPLKNIDTTAVAEALMKEFLVYGFPRELLSDNGPQFRSHLLRVLCEMIGCQKKFSAAYYPRSNGRIERAFQDSNHSLYAPVQENKRNWDEAVKVVQCAHNTGKS